MGKKVEKTEILGLPLWVVEAEKKGLVRVKVNWKTGKVVIEFTKKFEEILKRLEKWTCGIF